MNKESCIRMLFLIGQQVHNMLSLYDPMWAFSARVERRGVQDALSHCFIILAVHFRCLSNLSGFNIKKNILSKLNILNMVYIFNKFYMLFCPLLLGDLAVPRSFLAQHFHDQEMHRSVDRQTVLGTD